MKLEQLIEYKNEKLLGDARLSKMIHIALMHDHTLSSQLKMKLGPRITDKEAMEAWLDILENKINTGHNLGTIDQEKKFFDWVTRLYANNSVELEDLTSRGIEALWGWYALSRRNLLKPEDRDFNKFLNFNSFVRAMSKYRTVLEPIKDAEKNKDLYKTAKSITLVDNDQYKIAIPLNYGASCQMARSIGDFADWCTGTTTSDYNWRDYFKTGPLIIFQDKKDPGSKFQMHGYAGQFMDKRDHYVNQKDFAEKYPNAMNQIIDGLSAHSKELEEIWPNMDNQINLIKNKFKAAFGDTVDGYKAGDIVRYSNGTGRITGRIDSFRTHNGITNVKVISMNDPDEVSIFPVSQLQGKVEQQ